MNFKKLFLALSVLLASFSFQSCEKDEPAQPSNNLAGSSDKENQKEEQKEEQKEVSFKDICGDYKATYYFYIDDAFTDIDDLDDDIDLIYAAKDVKCKVVEGANNSLIFEDDIKFTNFVKDDGDFVFDVKSNNSDYHLIPVESIILNGESYGGEFVTAENTLYFACQVPVCEIFDDYSDYIDAMVAYWELDLDDPEDEEFFDTILDDDYDNAMVYLLVKAEKK